MNSVLTLQKIKQAPRKGALIYFLLGIVWVFLMSVLLPRTIPDFHPPHWIEILAYLIFVVLSAGTINFVIQHYLEQTILSKRELQESRDLFHLMAENAQDVIFRLRLTPAVHMDYISPAITKILGYVPGAFYKNPRLIFKLVHPDDQKRLRDILPSARLLSESHILRWISKEGNTVFVEHRNTPILDEDGNVIAVEGIARDVTKQKKLESTHLRLASIVESSGDAIVGKDLDARITDWNKGAEMLYGYSKDEVLGKPISILFPPDSQEEIDSIMNRVEAGERIAPYETIRVTKNGTRVQVVLTVSPIKDINGTVVGAAAIAQDVTLTHRVHNQDIRRTKVETSQRFGGLVAQQFESTCENIRKNARSALHKTVDPDARQFFTSIIDSTIQTKSITKRLLSYAVPPQCEIGSFSLLEFWVQLNQLAELILPANLVINLDGLKSNPTVIADIRQLQKLSIKTCAFLGNYFPEGGRLHLESSTPTAEDLEIHRKNSETEYIAISITAPDLSLNQQQIEAVFEPFISDAKETIYSNISLAAAYPLLRQMGGWFDINSDLGGGTQVVFGLRLADSSNGKYREIKVSRGAETGVLIVDEDAKLCELFMKLLSEQGYKVFTALDGEHALKQYQKQSDVIEIIYSDLGVPGLSGVELAREIKLINPNVKFIGATRFGELTETDTAYLSDFHSILQKPFENQIILDALLKAQLSTGVLI